MLKRFALATVLTLAFLPTPLCAQGGDWGEVQSDRGEVRERIADGGWNVLYGELINEAEYLKIGGCIYFQCLPAYFQNYVHRSVDRMQNNFPGIAYEALLNVAAEAIQNNGRIIFRVGRMGIAGGLATYRRWKKVSYGEPYTEEYRIDGPFGTWTKGYRPAVRQVEREVPLDNHHQPYIKFRLL